MTERPYQPAIEALRLCEAALERILPADERRIILDVHRKAVARLEGLVRADAARMAKIVQANIARRLMPEQLTAERAQVAYLSKHYRATVKGRYSREGAARFISATSKIPKRRVIEYLKEHTHVMSAQTSAPEGDRNDVPAQ